MSNNPQEYKCPCCGGALAFDSTSQKIKCQYCDTEFEMKSLQSLDEKLKAEEGDDISFENETTEWSNNEIEGMCSYVCKSCGGEIIADKTTGATQCPYCNNPVVMMDKFKGMLKPDIVVPFKKNKEDAKAAYLRHITGKKLLPPEFKEQNHIDEIKAVYIPFWLFEAKASGSASYEGRKIKEWTDENYRYTKTDFYNVVRSGDINFRDIPVDASKKMEDDLMDSVEPYDMNAAVPFQTAYLAGYMADKYDVEAKEAIVRANERIKNDVVSYLKSDVRGYNVVQNQSASVKTSDGKSRYALLPVWLLSTKYKNENYLFAMNGQTGKMVGDLPSDPDLVSKYRMKYAAIGFVIAAIIGFLSAGMF